MRIHKSAGRVLFGAALAGAGVGGADSVAGIALPGISIEIDPRISPGGVPVTFASLNYVPNVSMPPSAPVTPTTNTWQPYDAAAAGSRWYLTGAAGTVKRSTQYFVRSR